MITSPKEKEIEFVGCYYNQDGVNLFEKMKKKGKEKKKEVEVKSDFRFFLCLEKLVEISSKI